MLIRRLERADLHGLLGLYRHLHADDEAPSAAAETIWHELLSSARYRYLGGFVNEALVASCALTIIPNLTRGCRPYGLIENVVTAPEHRRKGFGKAVLERALEEAWAAGCYKVMLLSGRKDDATLRFYEAAGFDRSEKQGFIARPRA